MAEELNTLDGFELAASEQDAFAESIADGIGEAVAKAKEKIIASRTEARQQELLKSAAGCKQLLSEMKRPPGAGKAVSDWWRSHELLERRATLLDSLQAHESRLRQLDSQGDQSSAAGRRVEVEAQRLRKMLF